MYLSSTTTRQYIVEVSRLVQKFFNENVTIGLDRRGLPKQI